ncbi:hypothetical protein A3B45_02335 [Candidatus Daviesbacteria bacterium RIFCSPLOWO2_01_FULL_39_12]|uniref:DNA polymerase III delta N-terminal domain-containing protein n=1 Tax=Candidatus Daviesbacteria bacterium RIFCSPLOWO2_01_FULL_39_12 TaxID=1797785 RepID=A0A1F5KSP1_9BACT|nr:MAG: hypothetical protein A3D79_00745 [Candidatus Daviesbacteria bacterium RIFCSPHIGHO2_02_FULL_39_8]OGE43845.1 MAG: hypothetical protein A3B45_02335 [Candidatus Daviesbacteria bacterium RIFCSPLOWO2_01_FULL_39_12]
MFDPSTSSGQGSVENIQAVLMTPSLLSEEQLIILENPDETFTDYTLYPIPYTLIFWFDHEVLNKKPIMEWVKKEQGELLFFPEAKEVSVFPFLDLLASGDKKAFLEMDKLKKANYDTQYFITMIFYLLRSLAVIPKNALPFVKQKLERQRKRFNLEKIENLYKDILKIDFKIKSGLMEKDQAEFLLINKFIF